MYMTERPSRCGKGACVPDEVGERIPDTRNNCKARHNIKSALSAVTHFGGSWKLSPELHIHGDLKVTAYYMYYG